MKSTENNTRNNILNMRRQTSVLLASKTRNNILTLGFIAAVLLSSFLLNDYIDAYVQSILRLCAIYTIVALSMNLVNGFAGMFSLGQAGFMAIGAYAVAIFTVPSEIRSDIFYIKPMAPYLVNIELPLIAAIFLGALVAAFVAFLIGFPVLRLRGDYLAIATLGFSEIIRILFMNTQTITNGSMGIKGIPRELNIFYYVLAAVITVIILRLLISSSFGRAFKAIREDDIVAEAIGIGLFKHKLMAFVTSGFFAGFGGALFAAHLGTVDPSTFKFMLTFDFLLIIVLGGLGSISGTVISAIIVTVGKELLRALDEPFALFGVGIPLFRPGFRMVIFSLLLMVVVIFWQKGLMGKTELSWSRVFGWFNRISGSISKKSSPRRAVSQSETNERIPTGGGNAK